MASGGIDRGKLLARCLGNDVLAGELYTLFRTMAVAEADVLFAALASNDVSAAKASAHRLKSAASTVAADRLHALLTAMEAEPRLADFDAIAGEIAICVRDSKR